MDEDLERIGKEIVDAAVKLHILTGPGLLESVYESLLANGLEQRGLMVERQKWISLDLEGVRFQRAFRVDLLVKGRVVVEVNRWIRSRGRTGSKYSRTCASSI